VGRSGLVAAVAAGLGAISRAALPVTPVVAPGFDGSFPVTITLNATLAGLHPNVVSGSWLCSARAMSKPAIDAEIGKINALVGLAAKAEFASALEYRAHYLGQQTTTPFALAGGGTSASQTISIKVKSDDLVDPTSKHLIEQPAVMVGCWLHLANAAGQSVIAYQVAKPSVTLSPLYAMAQLTSRPYFLASVSVPSG
jgi:hypothetical protein